MYLLTTINLEECGWEISAKGDKKEMEQALEDLKRKVWYNEDGSKKMFSDIYDDTRAKNAVIVTNRKAESLLGGKRNLEMAEDFFYNVD